MLSPVIKAAGRRALVSAAVACLSSLLATTAGAQNTYTYVGGGGDNNTNTAGNYSGGNTPGNAQVNLHFNVTGGGTVNNNFADYGPGFSLFFDSGSGSVDLSGNAIKFYDFNSKASLIQNNSANDQTIQSRIGILRSNTSQLSDAAAGIGMDLSVTTAHQLVIGDTVASAQSVFFDESAGYLRTSGVANSSVVFNSAIVNGSTTGKVIIGTSSTLTSFTTVFNGVNAYTGETDINGGTLQVNAAPSATSAAYYLGNGGTTNVAASLLLGGGVTGVAGGITFSNPVTGNAGSSSNRVIGGSNTSGTNTYAGTLTLANSNANLVAATGGTVAFNLITATGVQTVAVGGGTNTGTVQLAGTADNVNVAASVNTGTLTLAKTSSSSVHAIGAGLTVNTGGSVLLGGSGGDQIYDAATLVLNGGTFNTAGLSERVGALTLSNTSAVDLGAGTSTLTFGGNSTRTTGTLAFSNWTSGSDHIFFYNASTGTTAFDLSSNSFINNITINGFGVTELGTGEIVPVPEPATWLAGFLVLGGATYLRRRRRSAA